MARVLVVDEDAWTQRMVSAVLSHGGHLVDVASDGWEALICAGRARPDLVVTELQLPSSDGWTLAGGLRSRPGSGDVPFIFMASLRSPRAPGPNFRAATDQLMPKPFRLEQLETAVAIALAGSPARASPAAMVMSAPPPPPRPPPIPRRPTPPSVPTATGPTGSPGRTVLAGSLDDFGLSSVLIVLELERKSGVVALQTTGGVGRIALRQGRVIRAHIEGDSERRGPLAVYEMLAWSGGRFEFQSLEVAGEDEIGSSTSFLLLEGARLQDERNHDKNHN
jgi:CheY-like chemotaxis protein